PRRRRPRLAPLRARPPPPPRRLAAGADPAAPRRAPALSPLGPADWIVETCPQGHVRWSAEGVCAAADPRVAAPAAMWDAPGDDSEDGWRGGRAAAGDRGVARGRRQQAAGAGPAVDQARA